MDIQIVPVSEAHVESYHACLDLVARERRYIGIVEAPPLDACRVWIAENIAKQTPYFVALDKEQVVGWCDIKLTDRPGFTHRGRLGMGVHPNYRGRRIGTRLLARCVEQTRGMGIERVELEVYASNAHARHLYQMFGFIVEGHKTRARKLDGVYDDIIDMVLVLQSSKANAIELNALVPELYCSNFATSRAFYTEVLGFHVLYERVEEGFAYFDRDGAQLMIDEISKTRTWLPAELEKPYGRGMNLEIRTQNVDVLYAQVQRHDAVIFLPMEEKWYRCNEVYLGNRQFIVQDPDGYLLRFSQALGVRQTETG